MHGELLVILGPQPQTTKEIAVRKTLAGLRGADLALGAVTISMVQGTVHGALAQGTRRNFVSARRLDTARYRGLEGAADARRARPHLKARFPVPPQP